MSETPYVDDLAESGRAYRFGEGNCPACGVALPVRTRRISSPVHHPDARIELPAHRVSIDVDAGRNYVGGWVRRVDVDCPAAGLTFTADELGARL